MKGSRKALLLVALAALGALLVGSSVAMARQDTPVADAQYGPGPGPGRPGPGRHMLAGEVTKVEGNTITIKTLKGEEKSVKVDDSTRYRKPPDGEATLADVKVGEKIAAGIGRVQESQDLLARVILIGEPPARGSAVVGDVVAVDGNKLTIKTADGSEKQFELPQVAAGNRVGVALGPDGAVRGLMYDPPERPAGAPMGPDGGAGPPPDDGVQPPAEGEGA